MISIVLDTNVLVSGMINAFGAPGRIIDLIREGLVELVVDDRILAEYADVLNRSKFRVYFQLSDVRDMLVFLDHNTRYIVSTHHVTDLPDADDAPFMEVALTAEVPLVTGNANHYPMHRCGQARIQSPAAFLQHFTACAHE